MLPSREIKAWHGRACRWPHLASIRKGPGIQGIVREYIGASVGSSEAASGLPIISIPFRLFRRADRQPYNERIETPVQMRAQGAGSAPLMDVALSWLWLRFRP